MQYGIELRAVTAPDLRALRAWRNSDGVRLQMQDTRRILPAQQRAWFERIQRAPFEWHRVVWCRGLRAGYVNLKGREGQPWQGQEGVDAGLYLGHSEVRHPMLAVAAALAQLDAAFDTLRVASIHTRVRIGNEAALRLNERLGYRVVARNDEFVTLALSPDDYHSANALLRRFFR